MFRVVAATIDEYFRFDVGREGDLRAVDAVIAGAAPGLARHFVGGTPDGKPGMTMKLIGYGTFQYHVKASSEPIDWPVIGLALQKNSICLYVAAMERGECVADRWRGRLGKASAERNIVRFASAAALDMTGLAAMAAAIDEGVRLGTMELRYGRVAG